MISLCFSDLPVSGKITALAISGIMIICFFLLVAKLSVYSMALLVKKKRYLLVLQSPLAFPVTC
jgi:hypothetical protein